ncbi:hypothetical protein F4678DRAFT_456176 [Xylaria arbuscula]|nr:hypothetical protein F4678DRAFT_456176 [Xylaria arbuscula]
MLSPKFIYFCCLLNFIAISMGGPLATNPKTGQTHEYITSRGDVTRFQHEVDQRDEPSCPNNPSLLLQFYNDATAKIPSQWVFAFTGGLIFGTSAHFGSQSVCRLFTSSTPPDQNNICADFGIAVGNTVFTSVAVAIGLTTYPQATTGTESQDLSGVDQKRSNQIASLDLLLRRAGLEFESMVTSGLVSRDRNICHVVEIPAVRVPGFDVPMDHSFHLRDNGTSFVRAIPVRGSLDKRHPGPGIKVSWETTATPAQASQFDQAALQYAGQAVGKDWAKRMSETNWNRYFGYIDFGGATTVNYEIIIETETFGDEYEDVHLCGFNNHD